MFSTITPWPSTSPSASACTRALASMPPPAANGTIRVIGLAGQPGAASLPDWAEALAVATMMESAMQAAAIGYDLIITPLSPGRVCVVAANTSGADRRPHQLKKRHPSL